MNTALTKFYTYNKTQQELIIYQVCISTTLYIDFIEKYEIVKHSNLHNKNDMYLRLIYTYFFIFVFFIQLKLLSLRNKQILN